MSELVRLSMSIERSLYEQLEEMVRQSGAGNRSEFIRDLLRTHLAIREWGQGGRVHGTISMVYDHHTRGLPGRLVELQHDCSAEIKVTTHVHLDHHRCMEVLIIHGTAAEIHLFTARLRQVKGVEQVALSLVGH